MKKFLGALLVLTMVAFTSNASTNDNLPIGVEYVVSVNSVDFVVVATEVPTASVVINVADKSVNYIASVEGLAESDNFVNGNSNKVNFAKVYLPNEVGLTNKANYSETNFAKTFLPNEVGLTKENV